MTQSPTTSNILLQHAVTAAISAWQQIHHYFKSDDLDVFQKSDGPATAADRLADKLIIETLQKLDPEAGFLTEESEDNLERLEKNRVWIIDPIDGTTEFMKGSPEFAMHIGAVEKAADSADDWKPILGVVFIPMTGELFFAQKNQGAYLKKLNAKEIIKSEFELVSIDALLAEAELQKVSDVKLIDDTTVVVSKSNSTKRLNSVVDQVSFGKVMRKGSLGVKVMEVVRQNADVYLHTELNLCKEWDLCAPQVILEEAGGHVTVLNGKSPVYNKPVIESMQGVVASNESCHDNVLEAVNKVLD